MSTILNKKDFKYYSCYIMLRILPVVLIVRGDSRKVAPAPRASMYTVWSMPTEHRVYYLGKTWGRASSFEPDQRTTCCLAVTCWLAADDVHIGGCVNKLGVAVAFEAEERQSETSMRKERSYLRHWVFKLYLLRYGQLNELFVLTILVYPCRTFFWTGN